MFKFKIKMLLTYFVDYCTNLNEIHNYNTRQKAERDYHHLIVKMEKRLNHECLKGHSGENFWKYFIFEKNFIIF